MKKKFMFAFLITAAIMCTCAFAETGIFIHQDLGEYKIVYTERYPHVWPHGPSTYLYFNCGVIDSDNNFIIEPTYKEIKPHKDGRALFCDNLGLYGFFDENWNVAIRAQYTYAADFSEGLAHVSTGKWQRNANGFIDRDGNVIIPLIYNWCSDFKDGISEVQLEEEGYHMHSFYRFGKIDKEGNILEELIYRHEPEYEIGVGSYNIRINGIDFDNSTLGHPFIYHMGSAYIPLTYYSSRALGFSCDWSAENGVMLSDFDGIEGYLKGNPSLRQGSFYKASLYTGKLTIGAKTYTAEEIYYPILTYNNIVYIPVLWKQGMEALGLNYSYELETNSLTFSFS